MDRLPTGKDRTMGKQIEVCKLTFWDGTKFILNEQLPGWEELRTAAVAKKQLEFNELVEKKEILLETRMCKEEHVTMDEIAYNKRPASQELHNIEKEGTNGKDKDKNGEDSE